MFEGIGSQEAFDPEALQQLPVVPDWTPNNGLQSRNPQTCTQLSPNTVWIRTNVSSPIPSLGCPKAGRPLPRQIWTGSTFQISRAYSLMARSLENFPIRAVFKMAIFDQRDFSRKAASTFFWHSL